MAVTEPQERDEIPVMRVSTTMRHTQDSEQIVPEWMKERRGPRWPIPRDFQVAEADRLAYTRYKLARGNARPCGSFVPGSRFLFPRGVILDLT